MAKLFAMFSECPVAAGQEDQTAAFVRTLKDATENGDTLILTGQQIVASPNFRRALRSQQFRPELRALISDKNVAVALMDGKWLGDKDFQPFSFQEIMRWMNGARSLDGLNAAIFDQPIAGKDDLWTFIASEWRNPAMDAFRTLNPHTLGEIDFLDQHSVKYTIDARSRDPKFSAAFIDDLGNAQLVLQLGDHAAAFSDIARDVYDSADERQLGMINVIPYPPAGNANIIVRFADYLAQQGVDFDGQERMLNAVAHFANAKMLPIVETIIGARAILSTYQEALLPYIENTDQMPGRPKKTALQADPENQMNRGPK